MPVEEVNVCTEMQKACSCFMEMAQLSTHDQRKKSVTWYQVFWGVSIHWWRLSDVVEMNIRVHHLMVIKLSKTIILKVNILIYYWLIYIGCFPPKLSGTNIGVILKNPQIDTLQLFLDYLCLLLHFGWFCKYIDWILFHFTVQSLWGEIYFYSFLMSAVVIAKRDWSRV